MYKTVTITNTNINVNKQISNFDFVDFVYFVYFYEVIMNRKKEPYDRFQVGERIKQKRTLLGMSQEELAEKIDRATKYCSDIERGICGMSVETMISFSKALDMSMDYIIFGDMSESDKSCAEDDVYAIVHLLSNCSDKQRSYALKMLKLFLIAIDNTKQ